MITHMKFKENSQKMNSLWHEKTIINSRHAIREHEEDKRKKNYQVMKKRRVNKKKKFLDVVVDNRCWELQQQQNS